MWKTFSYLKDSEFSTNVEKSQIFQRSEISDPRNFHLLIFLKYSTFLQLPVEKKVVLSTLHQYIACTPLTAADFCGQLWD